ncbi:MAG: M23 family metallopeptidase [Kordiimonadaceae bacterium]|nr:M23 family metallopeptidase [Kordiimonadaceae bacterium]MBO6568821.1 M23 family metallopeptidase [Kordiimonadaceae bacterium]MBO6965204.1 M23 family metallopeptidase [Kordiimonadaceae bacterium]
MKNTLFAVACFMGASAVAPNVLASDLIVRTSPSESIYANVTNPRFGYKDLAIHSIGFLNTGSSPITITDVSLALMVSGNALLTKSVPSQMLLADSADLANAPLPIFRSFQLLSEQGENGFFGQNVSFSDDATLEPNEALVTSKHHFSYDADVSSVRVEIKYRDEKGAELSIFKDIEVINHASPIRYQLPVQGNWFMRALPGIESHHRLNAATEFAVDFFKLTEDGRSYAGDRIVAENYPGYGQPVLAAAPGEVVHIEREATQDRQAYLPKDGETRQQMGQRLQRAMMQAFSENPRRAAGGNLITIRHEQNGQVEYSSYGHLKAGSIQVRVGDKVEAGDTIAEVGDTGDSPAVHLHFQLNKGPDAFLSESIPVRFGNIRHAILPAEPGLVVSNN